MNDPTMMDLILNAHTKAKMESHEQGCECQDCAERDWEQRHMNTEPQDGKEPYYMGEFPAGAEDRLEKALDEAIKNVAAKRSGPKGGQ